MNFYPVFIGGCGRSGTTMLGSILGNTSQSFTTPESHFKNKIFTAKDLIGLENDLRQNFSLKNWDVDISDLPFSENGYLTICELLNRYKRKNKLESQTIWIDHTPENFKSIDLLLKHFPQSKFIHIVRDPRAIVNSIIHLPWGPNTTYTASKWWIENVSFGLNALNKYPSNVILTRYEDLVSNTSEEIKRLCDFCLIPFEENMIEGDKKFLPNYTKKQHELVGSGPSKVRAFDWEKRLSKNQIGMIERICGSNISMLGYQRRCEVDLSPFSRKYDFIYHILDFLLFVKRKPERFMRRFK